MGWFEGYEHHPVLDGVADHADNAEAVEVRQYTTIFEDVAIEAGFGGYRLMLEAEMYAYEVAANYERYPAFAEKYDAGDVAIGIEHAAVNALLREREGELEAALDLEHEKVSNAVDDPMTQHYGVGGEVAEIVGRKAREMDHELERIWLTLRWRGAEPWPKGW